MTNEIFFIDRNGKKHKTRNLSVDEERQIRAAYLTWNGESLKSIAKRFNISVKEVEFIGGKSILAHSERKLRNEKLA